MSLISRSREAFEAVATAATFDVVLQFAPEVEPFAIRFRILRTAREIRQMEADAERWATEMEGMAFSPDCPEHLRAVLPRGKDRETLVMLGKYRATCIDTIRLRDEGGVIHQEPTGEVVSDEEWLWMAANVAWQERYLRAEWSASQVTQRESTVTQEVLAVGKSCADQPSNTRPSSPQPEPTGDSQTS